MLITIQNHNRFIDCLEMCIIDDVFWNNGEGRSKIKNDFPHI